MQVWGVTDRGAVRQQNQDAYAARVLEDGRVIALVCDGMGGARAGNVASTMAVELFMEEFLKPGQEGPMEERMGHAASVANQAVFHRSVHDDDCAGMGTTMVAVLAGEREAVILNEGDSRAYHINTDGIVLVTRDHSLVQSMVERGDITAEEARRHPNRNLITRALGPDVDPECDCYTCQLLPGDFLLLCTDGLVSTVTDQEMEREILRGDDNACLDRLLDIARDQGAPDNVTAVLLRQQ